MAPRWIAAAFLASLAVPLAEALAPEIELARGSLSALALLPWLALASFPRAEAERERARATLVAGACALPPLGLAAGLDLARGADGRALALAAGAGWLILVLWTAAAEWAAGAARARRVFAALWLALVPGAAALRVALAWVPARGAARPGAGLALAVDPLVWCHRWARAGGLAELARGELVLAVLASGLIFLAVLALARSAREGAA